METIESVFEFLNDNAKIAAWLLASHGLIELDQRNLEFIMKRAVTRHSLYSFLDLAGET